MTIVSSGTISINSLVAEYGGSAPHAMNEYYRGGGLVADHSNNANVPTSGTIDLADFYGANNTSPSPTQHNYSMTTGTNGVLEYGFHTGNYGSISPNPQSTAFASGWNPTITKFNSTTVKANSTITLECSGTLANSGWDRVVLAPSLNSSGSGQTLYRSGGNHSTGGGYTQWQWNTSYSFATSTTTATWGIYA
jgi:hypothetical protein